VAKKKIYRESPGNFWGLWQSAMVLFWLKNLSPHETDVWPFGDSKKKKPNKH
jgi:hypothetical protein